ncbi:MAG: peptidase M15 [Proteobacteria bacterium]|nr:peptidase M15 [Pseudomonadota bacterium]
MPMPGLRNIALAAALAAAAMLTALPAEARPRHRSHTATHAHVHHKHYKHRARTAHRAHRSHSGSVAGTGTGCLPGILKTRLAQIASKFGSVQVISTFRAGARIGGGKPSFHASCRAVDFNPPPGKYSQVVAWLHANHSGGVGTYSCGMHHIHIDNGPRVHFHHCQSG